MTRVCLEFVRRLRLGLLPLALLLTCASPVWALGALSNEETLEVERLGEEGVGAYQAGQYQKALTALATGYERSAWGTIGVWLAKTHEKLGEPLEAHHVYAEVAAGQPSLEEPAPFAQARDEARASLYRLELTCAVVELRGAKPGEIPEVTVNGAERRVSKVNTVAVLPGEVRVEVRWEGGHLPEQTFSLQAGQRREIDLGGMAAPGVAALANAAPSTDKAPAMHTLDFNMVEVTGWTLHDGQGNEVCTLPCKWSGTDPENLTVRQGEQKLPVRLARKHTTSPNVLVSVNPERGSKGWALGIGIPSGILFGGFLVAAADPETRSPGLAATGAVAFGAGFGLCAWWFIWSKSRPYLDYELPKEASPPQQAGVGLEFYGNGVGLNGRF